VLILTDCAFVFLVLVTLVLGYLCLSWLASSGYGSLTRFGAKGFVTYLVSLAVAGLACLSVSKVLRGWTGLFQWIFLGSLFIQFLLPPTQTFVTVKVTVLCGLVIYQLIRLRAWIRERYEGP
jgi:hypothetical protein